MAAFDPLRTFDERLAPDSSTAEIDPARPGFQVMAKALPAVHALLEQPSTSDHLNAFEHAVQKVEVEFRWLLAIGACARRIELGDENRVEASEGCRCALQRDALG